ncbi:sigma-70 family RNA polymerase sigma factor [Actinocorallia sp. A-T 12471]|uniref:sigma-70 family RNA polymerase sigma factor n=1 Tax=Actinocorallia sp. A-T 12471 TaxID=3089813 RepID=UPI0029D40DA2|nr:sigma-70 family RNA polymerase sigma factor [Actinocorallia sp. A-T 12471]MDX6743985.1 sigma-70 family RNA polymerase sigma factor [Actinocorallia sp. A-T 12471]
MGGGVRARLDAVWKLESATIVAAAAAVAGDVGTGEDCAQEALLAALDTWPDTGVPDNPGAWLTTVAKRRALDHLRRLRRARPDGDAVDRAGAAVAGPGEGAGDEVLRLMLVTCHPVLPARERVALTLRLVAGLSAAEIARALLTAETEIVRRIAAARAALARAGVAFDRPEGAEFTERLGSVLGVVYLVFNEGYSATSGGRVLRPELVREALRLGRTLAALAPDESEVHGLVALMELQASRSPARIGPDGAPVPLHEQVRGRWDPLLIRRGFTAMLRARDLGGPPGPYLVQAAIAACHARAASDADTDWPAIAALYAVLDALTPSPVVRLNRAAALGRAEGPEAGLALLAPLTADPSLRDYHLLPAVQADLLERAGRPADARIHYERAAALTANDAERGFLLRRADAVAAPGPSRGRSLGEAGAAFLAGRSGATARSYAQTLARLCRALGDSLPLADADASAVAGAVVTAWGSASPRTWNRHVSTVRSFAAWAGRPDLGDGLALRPVARARAAPLPAQEVARLWSLPGVGVREVVLWRVLHESAAPIGVVLDLNVEDLDLASRRAGAVTWSATTADLLSGLVAGRTRGPVFLTDRRPAPSRAPASPRDVCPETGRVRLSYERAEYLFKSATRRLSPSGLTLGRLRDPSGPVPGAK